jgi:hypothetical protein
MGVLLKDRKDLGCLGFLDETHPHDGLGSQKQRSESGWFSEPSNDKLAVPAKLKGVCTLYHFDYLLFDKRVEQLLGILLCNILHI